MISLNTLLKFFKNKGSSVVNIYKMEKCYIYSLTSEGVIFYIGKTIDINRRFKDHKNTAKNKRNYKERFINKLLLDGKMFEMNILEEVEIGQEDFWEKWWISKISNEQKLCNTTSGGDGGDYWLGKKHSEETKDKIRKWRVSEIQKGKIHKSIGESNGRSKLTENNVIEMRKLRDEGYSYKQLSIKYRVAKSTVINIIKRIKWTHI